MEWQGSKYGIIKDQFIMFVNKHPDYLKTERYTIAKYFRSIDMITMVGIKEYYLKIFKNIKRL